LAKITEVTVDSFATQFAGMFPVFVEPTCTPEELKALEVVMGEGKAPTASEQSLTPYPMPAILVSDC
jgi:hypothetical protein